MYRQSPGRNQRSKGIKVKHILQICLLLAVCFWLIYQVKRSHDKKKEFDESSGIVSLGRESSESLIKLGRKDVQEQMKETTGTRERHDGEEEDETIGEDREESKHEEDESEESKAEVNENDMIGGEDDDIEEHEQEKLDDRGEDLIDEERVDGDENRDDEKVSEDDDGRTERESHLGGSDRDGDDANTHEAQEELYKADDASSAVTQDTRIVNIENETEHEANSNPQKEDIMEPELKEKNDEGEKRKELEEESGEVDKDLNQLNLGSNESSENMAGNSQTGSLVNETVIEEMSHNSETGNSSTTVTMDISNLSSSNVSESGSSLDRGPQISTEGTSAEGSDLQTVYTEKNDTQSTSNSTIPEETENSNSEKSDTDDTANILKSEKNEIPQEIEQESIGLSDSTNSLEEKDVRTDLDTLPEIQTIGSNNEDSAAE